MKKNSLHFLVASGLVIVGTIVAYIVLSAIYQLPRAASAEAVPIDQLFRGHFFMIAFLFALIVVFMLYSVVVFRRREGDESDGVHFHGNTALEIAWTVVPLVAVVVFGVWGQQALNEISRQKENELVVTVIGRQWSWEFQYPEYDNLSTSNEMYLPVDRTILLELRSEGLAEGDPGVNHAFWIPEFRVKRDLIPGHDYTMRITPTEEGDFRLRCAELCGTGHATMLADVHVVSQAEFDTWARETAAAQAGVADLTPPERGQMWANQSGCLGCHSVDGTTLVGPTWQGLYGAQEQLSDGTTVEVDDEYLHTAIAEPDVQVVDGFSPGIMPDNFDERLSEEQIQDIIAYIKSLSE